MHHPILLRGFLRHVVHTTPLRPERRSRRVKLPHPDDAFIHLPPLLRPLITTAASSPSCQTLDRPPTKVCVLPLVSFHPTAEAETESAPLLDHPDEHQSFFSALFHPSRPLTNLEKILAGASILLLLLTSTFIGLFAGSQNSLGRERGDHEAGRKTETLTATETATRTSIATTTVSAVPTGKPEAVSLRYIFAYLSALADEE